MPDHHNAAPCAALTFDLDGLARDMFPRAMTEREIGRLQDLAFDVVVPRILGWLDRVGVRATFFSIGADVERWPSAFAAIARAGHEVASHTFAHPRDFSRQGAAAVRADLERADATIASATGVKPRGFRAPGYTISSAVIRVLGDLGYAYDASVVPSWSYSTLKRLFRWVGGREYRGYLFPQEFACARAPRLPYPIDPSALFAPSRDARLVEIPLTAIGAFQFPCIHGLSVRLPAIGQRYLEHAAMRRQFFSFAFHDLEFSDRDDFGNLPASLMTESHLRTPIEVRLQRLSDVIARVKAVRRFVTLGAMAARTC
jgi:hypothetical protein